MIYARTIQIKRPQGNSAAGAQPYQGVLDTNESVVIGPPGIPASVQLSRREGRPKPNVPADAESQMGYNIFIPLAYSVLGQIHERDIVVDDLGKRYQVEGAYWNILGYNLSTTLLES